MKKACVFITAVLAVMFLTFSSGITVAQGAEKMMEKGR